MRKKGVYWALRSRNWEYMRGRRDHFRGWGKLELEVQHSLTSWEGLQPKTSLATLLPKVGHMGELVEGKGMCGGGPRCLRGHSK